MHAAPSGGDTIQKKIVKGIDDVNDISSLTTLLAARS